MFYWEYSKKCQINYNRNQLMEKGIWNKGNMKRTLILDDSTYYDIIDCIGLAKEYIEERIKKNPDYSTSNRKILEKIEELKELFYNL